MKNELIIKGNVETKDEEGIMLIVVNENEGETGLIVRVTEPDFMEVGRELSDETKKFIGFKDNTGKAYMYNKSEIKRIEFAPNFIIYNDKLFNKNDL